MNTTLQTKTQRLLSLDVLRGFAIFLMILVNSPGNDAAYSWLDHASWNGCTPADLVFPFFLFITGVSLSFSLTKQLAAGQAKGVIVGKIIKRSALIFLVGLFLNAFPRHFDFDTIRVYGVLQRIAICYCAAALLFISTSWRTQLFLTLIILVTYWLAMTMIPIPFYGAGDLSLHGNLAGYLDRMIFSAPHLYQKVFDPEGVLSTWPALATTLIGSLIGVMLLNKNLSHRFKLNTLLLAGVAGLGLGWTWGIWFPINKALWSSSFVLWTAGFALVVLALCYWLIDIKHRRSWSKPFEILGVNALAAYFLHIFFLKLQAMIHIPRMNGTPGNLRIFITEHAFGWAPIKTGSLLYAISYAVLWIIILGYLYRRHIIIKL